MNSEALLVSYYIYKARSIPNLTLITRNHLFPLSLRQTFSMPFAATDPALFPDACMCGKIHGLHNGNLRLCCPACFSSYEQTKWLRSHLLTEQRRAFQRMFVIDPSLAPLYMAAAIHLESRRLSHDNNSPHT